MTSTKAWYFSACRAVKVDASSHCFLFCFDSLPLFLVDQWLVVFHIPWSRSATHLYFFSFFFQGCTGAQCIFRLVLLGHTGYTTCNFRTTKQILFLFFVLLRICVRACVCVSVCCLQQSVRACVWFLTASCLGLKHFLCWTWRSQTGECKLSPEVVLNVFYEVIVEM